MKKNKLAVFINIIVQISFLWCLVVIDGIDKEVWLDIFFIMLVLTLLINLYTIKICQKELLNLPTLFFVFAYLFHFGHVPLMALGMDIEYPLPLLNRVSLADLIESWKFSYVIINSVVLGVLIFSLFIKPSRSFSLNEKFFTGANLKYLKVIGYVLIILGILPKLYIDMTKINVFLSSGYLAIYEVDISTVYYILSNFFFLGTVILLLAYHKNKKFAKSILLFGLFIYLISMFSGGRADATISIVMLIYVYAKFIERIKLSTLAILYGIALFITEITKFRQTINTGIGDFVANFSIESIISPFTAILAEFGGTQLTVVLALEHFPTNSNIGFAENYLLGLIYIVPFLSNILGISLDSIAYISQFPSNEGQYLGGSFIGELYFGLNKVAVIGGFIIGGFLTIFNAWIFRVLNKSVINFVCCLLIFGNVLWWVRDYFNSLMQDFIIIFIMVKMIEYILVAIMKKNKNI